MRDLEAGRRSRRFSLLPARDLGVKALGAYGKPRCGRRVAPGHVWRPTSASFPLSSGPQFPSRLPRSRVPVLTRFPFLDPLDCPKKGGDTD
jgi:hypothetical protein